MKLIWCKSNLPLSLVIRAATGEDCSHFAFVFESQAAGVVFQSNLLGTNIVFLNKDQKTWGFKIVHELDLPMTVQEEDSAWDNIVQNYSDVPYNFGGALYLGWRKFLYRLFKIAIPTQNKWSQPGTLFCDQVYKVLNQLKDPRLAKVCVMNGMDTPHDVWLKLKDVGGNK